MFGEGWIYIVKDYAVYIVAISTALAVIYRKGLLPMIKAFKTYGRLCEKVDLIFEELTPNNGKSVKDSIDRMDKGLSLVIGTQKAMLADDPAALFITDSEGNCIWINRTYSRVVGRDSSEILGHGWQNTIAQEDRESVTDAWYTAVEENREFFMNFKFETPDGKKIPARVRSYIIPDSKGEILGFYGHIQIL